jgi:phenylalanyl-tRNA synthetase beta chain
VQGADDVVEEIARMVGYETIPAEPLAGRVPPRVPQPVLELKERSRDILVRAGMQEAITYPLTSVSTLALVVPEEELARDEPLSIVNPLIVGQDRMRTSLRASMLECVARNQRNGRERVAMFEVARIYLPTSGSLPTEREHVVGAVTGPRLDRWGAPVEESVDFFDAKAFVARLFESLAVPVQYSDAECFGFLSGRTAELRVGEATAGGVSVGVLGQVHPETADKFGIGQDLYLFDIDLETLLPHVPDVVRFESVSKFPAVVEDLALIVGVEQTAASVIDEVLSHSLVTEAHVFDEYHGAPVPERKKSLAVAVSYQVPDRTLTDKEVAKARDKILARLRGKLGAELRR